MTNVAEKVREWDGKPITEAGLYRNIPMSVYHGPGLCGDEPCISSSGLRTIFNDSPMRYWLHSELNPNRLPKPVISAMIIGRAAHHLALGEAAFDDFFVVQPETYVTSDGERKPWHNGATVCKEWRQQQGEKEILSADDWLAVQGVLGVLPWQKDMVDSGILNHSLVKEGLLSGLVEHSLIWRDAKTGVWLRSRPDAFPVNSTVMGDLKTAHSIRWEDIQRTFHATRYDIQCALALEGSQQAIDLEITNFAFCFVENKPAHAVQTVELRPSMLEQARKDMRAAIDNFARCWERKRWPGPGGEQADGVFIEMPKWAQDSAAARRLYLEDT